MIHPLRAHASTLHHSGERHGTLLFACEGTSIKDTPTRDAARQMYGADTRHATRYLARFQTYALSRPSPRRDPWLPITPRLALACVLCCRLPRSRPSRDPPLTRTLNAALFRSPTPTFHKPCSKHTLNQSPLRGPIRHLFRLNRCRCTSRHTQHPTPSPRFAAQGNGSTLTTGLK